MANFSVNPSEKYKVLDISYQQTKTGKNMARINLKNCSTGDITNCTMWQEVIQTTDKKALKPNNIISIIDSQYNEQYKTLTLNKIILVEEAKIGISDKESDLLYSKIIKTAEKISDKKLSNAVLTIIKENETLFKTAPAAERIHHNFIGGLILHIWECIETANVLIPVVYKEINPDLVIAGCITHDLGKMFEYTFEVKTGIIGKNKEFQAIWINHIQWGFNWANQNGFAPLAHIIASHHGIKEWNALVEPMTPEANLVHQIDMISSRLGRINTEDL